MDTQDLRTADGGGDSSKRASLQLELRVPERQMLATFRDAFLRWLNDRSGPFARAVGASESLSLDEVPASDDPNGLSTLRLTVSWPLAETAATRQGGASMTVSSPALPPARREPVDQFVFFPDPLDAAAPLYHQLSAPIHAAAFQPPPGAPQLRVSRPIAVLMANNIADALEAIRAFAAASSRRLGISGLTVRVPLLARYPRGLAAGLVGAAAVTAGFVAGAIYLSTVDRTVEETGVEASLAPVVQVAPRAAPSAMAVPMDLAMGASLAPVDPAPSAAERTPRRAETPTSTTGSNAIADADVTTGPISSTERRSAALRRPEVVVVRAVEGAGLSATAAADTRAKGTLLVKSDPQGAEVSINGIVHGRTPLMIRDLGAGSRVLRLDLPGYERWSWAVAVVANKRTPVTVKLQPESRRASSPD